uniref:protein YgfX n=1 Tax=Crenothrix polyspora TaxID=360316 RepID=UPI0011774CD7|nr:protein YgfX [Crenothrix polyspora]
MLKKSQPLLQLTLQSSTRLKKFIIILHVLALAACMANALAAVFKMVLAAFVGVHFWFTHKRLKNEYWEIRHTDAGGWEALINGQFEAIRILDSSVITTFVIFLHFKYRNTVRCNLVILSDALIADDYRQFIVRLKTTSAK